MICHTCNQSSVAVACLLAVLVILVHICMSIYTLIVNCFFNFVTIVYSLVVHKGEHIGPFGP